MYFKPTHISQTIKHVRQSTNEKQKNNLPTVAAIEQHLRVNWWTFLKQSGINIGIMGFVLAR